MDVHSHTFAVASSEASRAEAGVVVDVIRAADSVDAGLKSFALVNFGCNKKNKNTSDMRRAWQW